MSGFGVLTTQAVDLVFKTSHSAGPLLVSYMQNGWTDTQSRTADDLVERRRCSEDIGRARWKCVCVKRGRLIEIFLTGLALSMSRIGHGETHD